MIAHLLSDIFPTVMFFSAFNDAFSIALRICFILHFYHIWRISSFSMITNAESFTISHLSYPQPTSTLVIELILTVKVPLTTL